MAGFFSNDSSGLEKLVDALVYKLLLVVVLVLRLLTKHGGVSSAGSQPVVEDGIDREQTSESAPFRGHVRDGQALVNRNGTECLVGAGEFNGVVQNLVLVEEAGKRDNNVLAGHTIWQGPSKVDLGHRWDLPPCFASRPDARGVGSDHRGSQASNAAVHVGVTVGSHSDSAWPSIALLDHDLVANTASSRVEDDVLLLGEFFNLVVLLQVLLRLVLHIVVERHDDLFRVVDLGCADGHKFQSDRP